MLYAEASVLHILIGTGLLVSKSDQELRHMPSMVKTRATAWWSVRTAPKEESEAVVSQVLETVKTFNESLKF